MVQYGEEIQDPNVISQLEGGDFHSIAPKYGSAIEDPDLLKQLDGDEEKKSETYTSKNKAEDQSFISKLPRNVLAGLLEGGRELANSPHNIAAGMENKPLDQETLAGKLGLKASDIPSITEQNFPKKLGLPEKATLMDKVIRGLGQYAPAMLIPEAEAGEGIAAGGNALSKFIGRGAELGAPQAAYSAAQNPENPGEAALTGLASGFVAPTLEAGYNALRPSQIFRGKLSPEELKTNLEATEGTNTGLGRVIESPSLMRMQENYLPHLIGSGAEDTMQKTAGQIAEKGENLLEKIRGELNPGDLGSQLQNALKKSAADARREKNAGFEELNKKADEAGLKIGREEFSKQASKVINDIEESPELKHEFSTDLYGSLKRYASNEEGNNLKLTNIFRGKLGDKAQEFYEAGKMHEYGIVKSLRDSLDEDISSAFEKSPHKDLKDLYEKNQKDYAEKFAPFEDKDIVKFTRQGGDPDLILPHFLRGGKNDRAYLLNKLTSNIPSGKSEMTPLLAYAHLSKAVDENGKVNPLKLSAQFRQLGTKQKQALIPDKDMRNELENFTNLVGKNTEAFDLMRNSKTGYRNTDLLIKMAELMAGHSLGGIPGAVLTGVGTGLAARGANKLLTSPKVRNSLVKKMIEGKESKIPSRTELSTIINSLLNQQGDQ